MAHNEQVHTRLAGLPDKPGVYLMKDANDRVIYVGKAKVLKHRVRSYFQSSVSHTSKTRRLVLEIADLEWIVTGSELEALILESELIKRYRPRFNIRLKDDKRYPYIKITLQEDYPRIFVVRRMQRDGARYYGPFASAQSVYQSLELLRRLFPYRTCNRDISGEDLRPCFYYHIKRCSGPCIGAISKAEYRATIDRACLFLEGKQEETLVELERRMREEADALKFERAAELRDQIDAVTRVIERQRIVSSHLNDHDFIAMARDDGQACVQVFFVRGGKLIGREYFMLTGANDETESDVMSSFVKQFYQEGVYVPPDIVVQTDLDELAVIQEWLNQKRGTKVTVQVPRKGPLSDVMHMATENAAETLGKVRREWEADRSKHVEALSELKELLELPQAPTRIECYDISNTQGTNATGSMVVFVHGAPSKKDYRRFRIKSVIGANDVASMAEVVGRRFKRAQDDGAKRSVDGKENPWARMPDLLIVDGGKGQLNAVREVMKELGVGHISTVGLAKQEEVIFVPGRQAPIVPPRNTEGLYLLQRIRDEAHRFAITYHRQLRQKAGTRSALDDVPGIGPKRRAALLKVFGSVAAIRQATVEELIAVPGMTKPVANRLHETL